MENKAVMVIEKDAKDIVAQAGAIVISNQQQYEGANEFLRADKQLQKRIHEAFDEIVASAYKTWKAAGQKRTDYLEPVVAAEKAVKGKMIDYTEEMERIRREEQRKIDAKAEADAEKERKRLAERAAKWAAKGNEAKAEAIQEQAEEVQVETQVVAPKIEKAEGVSFQTIWKFKIIDANKIPREYMMPDEIKLRRMAGAMKGIIQVAGVEFYSEKILKSRNSA